MTSSSLHDDYSHVTISGIRVPDDFSIITQDYYTSTSIPVPVPVHYPVIGVALSIDFTI